MKVHRSQEVKTVARRSEIPASSQDSAGIITGLMLAGLFFLTWKFLEPKKCSLEVPEFPRIIWKTKLES